MDVFDDKDITKGDAAFLRKHFVDLLRFRGIFAAEVRMRSSGMGCYAISLPFSRIASVVEEMKVEMPLSGRSFEQVSGWWSFKEDFISASFSTDRTRVFAYVGFETLGPTKKNGYNVDDASPALWRKLSLPDRERAFTSRIRQMAAVREVGNVQIATQRISTLFIQVEYTDEAGQAGLAKTLDRWQTHTLGDQDGDLRDHPHDAARRRRRH